MKKSALLAIAACVIPLTGFVTACATTETAENKTSYAQSYSDRIKVTKIGKGPDVILIPGLGSPPDVYDAVKDELAKTHTVHIVHVAGYAGLPLNISEGEVFNPAVTAISDYIKKNNIKDATIIGHSMGGEMAMAINARNDGLVKKVMVIDALPFYSLYLNPAATAEVMKPGAVIYANAIKARTAEEYETTQKVAIARLVKSEERRKEVLDWSKNSNRHAIAQGVQDLMSIDLRPELKNNKADITLLYGYDPMMGLTQEFVDNLYTNGYKDIPNVKKIRVDNSLHFIMYDQPEQFKREIIEFVK